MRLINGRFANYINIFHKTEVETVILRFLRSLNINWFTSYDTKSAKPQKKSFSTKSQNPRKYLRNMRHNFWPIKHLKIDKLSFWKLLMVVKWPFISRKFWWSVSIFNIQKRYLGRKKNSRKLWPVSYIIYIVQLSLGTIGQNLTKGTTVNLTQVNFRKKGKIFFPCTLFFFCWEKSVVWKTKSDKWNVLMSFFSKIDTAVVST